MSKEKGFVLLSGGVDSSTVLALASAENASTHAVSVMYGQRHTKEIDHATRVAAHFGCTHEVANIAGLIGIGGLTNAEEEIPDISYDDIEGVSPTYVPFRNGLLLALLTSRAHACKASRVYYGAHAEDAANWAYPDCTPEFIKAMGDAIRIGCYNEVELRAPFVNSTKAEVIQMGDHLGVPWQHTWSCYKGEELHCAVCPTCRARQEAFALAGVEDPTEYATGD